MSEVDVKVDCGCYAAWNGRAWIVTASSFLCDHRQGERVYIAPPEESRPSGEDTPASGSDH